MTLTEQIISNCILANDIDDFPILVNVLAELIENVMNVVIINCVKTK